MSPLTILLVPPADDTALLADEPCGGRRAGGDRVTPEETALARQLCALPGFAWDEDSGMLTHTTHTSRGCLPVPAGTPIREGYSDAVVEGRFGPIAEQFGHSHPDFSASCDRHDQTRAEAWSRVLPDLRDPATAGCLLGMLWAADPDAGWHVHGPPGLYCVHRADGTGEHYGGHLGVAVARALVAIGRAS